MADADSILDPAQMAKARAYLAKPAAVDRVWPALAAAAFAAVCALALAVTVITAPPPSSGERVVLEGAEAGAP